MRLVIYYVIAVSIFANHGVSASLNPLDWFSTALTILGKTVKLYDEINDFTDDPFHLSHREKQLYNGLNNATRFIERIETNIPQVTIARINELQRDFSEIIHFEIKLDELVKSINQIESQYDDFLILKNKLKSKLDNDTTGKAIALQYRMMDFAKVALSVDRYSIRGCLSVMNDLVDIGEGSAFSSRNDIFTLILNNFNDKTASRCLIDKSPQQLLHDSLTSFRLVQIKGMVILEFSYIILHLYTKGDFRDEIQETQDLMMKRLGRQAEIAYKVIEKADNTYWRCDPVKPIAGQTYTEITRFLQGYIHNEKELSNKGNCFDGCGYYQYVDRPRCSNDDSLCRIQPTCAGRVLDCRFVNDDMDICFANAASSRRYQYVRYSGGPTYGHSERSCPSGTSRIEKYRKLLLWRCLYCFCLCDEETNSDRFFSLEPAVSNLEKNNVVVGVRFTKQNRILHLQVREGTLGPSGMIDNTTVSWVPVANLSVGNWQDVPKYHKLTYESRALDLDDLVAPSGYLLTGVRLRMIGAHLNVEIRLTAFDFQTGVLYKNLTLWKGNDNTDVSPVAPRTLQKLEGTLKRLPTEYPGNQHAPDSQSDTYIEFQPSDDVTDAAQSTVPFIDMQSVAPNPPIPLIGLGIIHKGAIGSAGYIEPKVFTYNVAQHISNQTSAQEPKL